MLLNYLYPRVCGFCGKIIPYGSICTMCMEEIPYMGFNYIPYDQKMSFDELYCNYDYVGIVRSRILDFKFGHKKYLFKTFAEGMIYRYKKIEPKFDLIIPVPIHRSRRTERGYNQSELIAKALAKAINVKCNSRLLIKRNKNRTQSKLNKQERIRNVKGIFKIRKNANLSGKAILLIDDIYTTGATANECSKILKSAGATKVFVYTVAKATVNSHVD